MKFFYADTLDHVDPHFDFKRDLYAKGRIPHRDDVYAHQLIKPTDENPDFRPYHGLLVSRYALENNYSQALRQRFRLVGVRKFLRFPEDSISEPKNFTPREYPIMADCGAYNYRDADEPPYKTSETAHWYHKHGFTHGVSIDHMIDRRNPDHQEWRRRYDLTLENAQAFLREVKASGYKLTPIGIAQGWDTESYRHAVRSLRKMGYDYVALGGLVPLKTWELLEVLEAVRPEVVGRTVQGKRFKLHLFGVARLKSLAAFERAGVYSFDSTSPLLQAFKDARNNYYANDDNGHFTAVRIPKVDTNNKMRHRIRAGELDRRVALRAEKKCLNAIRRYDQGKVKIETVMRALQAYEMMFDGRSRWPAIERTLRRKPWKECPCPICKKIGVEVIIFRGANRNRRRGFHNLWFTQQKLQNFQADDPHAELPIFRPQSTSTPPAPLSVVENGACLQPT